MIAKRKLEKPRGLHLTIEAKAEGATETLALTSYHKGSSVGTGRRARCVEIDGRLKHQCRGGIKEEA